MKITLELARPGIWGTKDNPTPLTEEDLKEIVETFSEIKKAPVTLGHSLADFMPAFGWVTSLKYNKNALEGEIELNDLLSDAYEKKLYQNWSIGIRHRAKDGKKYLHHVAFLGEIPPKIKDLKIFDGKMVYSDDVDEMWVKIEGKKTNNKNFSKEPEGEEEMKEIERLKKKLEEKEELLADFEKKIKEEKKTKLMEVVKGIVPQGKHSLVRELIEIIPHNTELEFAEEDGSKRKMNAFDVLVEIFKSIPMPVEPNKFVFGEEDNGDNTKNINPSEIMDRI